MRNYLKECKYYFYDLRAGAIAVRPKFVERCSEEKNAKGKKEEL